MTTDTVRVKSAPVTIAAFDPVDWLVRFKAIKGVCLLDSNDVLSLSWQMLGRTPADMQQAQAIYEEIESDGERGRAVTDLVRAEWRRLPAQQTELEPIIDPVLEAYRSGEIKGPEAWTALLGRFDQIEAMPSSDMPEEEYDRWASLGGDLARAMMSMPAPNAAALVWKLDHVLANGNSYGGDSLHQTIADYRRFLDRAPSDTLIETAWRRRCETFLHYNKLPLTDPPEGELQTPEEAACWKMIDEDDGVIQANVARTPGGAFIQVKLALFHSLDDRGDEEAFVRGDMSALEGKDRGIPFMLAALRSLEAQAGDLTGGCGVPGGASAVPAIDESKSSAELYAAYRYAKGQYELRKFAPAYWDRDLTDKEHEVACNAQSEAMNRFLLAPAADLADLTRKIEVFRDEEIHDGWCIAGEIVGVLALDAQRIAEQEAGHAQA